MLSRKPFLAALSLLLTLAAAACGGDDSDDPGGGEAGADGGQAGSAGGASAQESCTAFCTPDEPEVEGAYSVCSAASLESCVQDCVGKIAKKSDSCAWCLMHYTDFGPPGHGTMKTCGANEAACPGAKECTVAVYPMNGQECSYCTNIATGEEDCIRTLFPRKEIECALPDWTGATSECKQIGRCL